MSSFEVLQLDRFGVFHNVSEHFEHSLYPAGEPYVKLRKDAPIFDVPTLVVGRIRGLTEMGYVHEVVRTLHAANVGRVSIFLPYFPGGRSDRVFDTDDLIMPRGLDLYVNLVKSAEPDHVFTLDMHSGATLDMLGDLGVAFSSAIAVESARLLGPA